MTSSPCHFCSLLSTSPAPASATQAYAEYKLRPNDKILDADEKTRSESKRCSLFRLVQDLYKIWCKNQKPSPNSYWFSCPPNRYIVCTHPDIWSALPAASQAVLFPDPLGPLAITRISQWMKECIEKHPKCRSETAGFRPTRLLDIGEVESDSDCLVRLIEPDDEVTDYVALSHCWGQSKSFTTTAETMSQMMSGFKADQAPATFRDAIRVTRQLGIRYLWIDSLCIIQGDAADWEAEASRMGEVYRGACLTISALRASDDREGFLTHRDPPTWTLRLFDSAGHSTKVYLRPEEASDTRNLEPLDTRAWTLQERYLSRRQIRFSHNKILWECQQMRQDEAERVGISGSKGSHTVVELTREPPYGRNFYEEWYVMISNYSTRNLSLDSDRLPALSGLAAIVAKHYGSQYCAGMWWEDIGYAICWATDDGQAREPSRYVAPSWSWASIIAKVDFLDQICRRSLFQKPELLQSVTLLDHALQYQGKDTYGQLKGGWLRLKAPTLSLTRMYRGEEESGHYAVDNMDGFDNVRVHFDLQSYKSNNIRVVILMHTMDAAREKGAQSEKSIFFGIAIRKAVGSSLEVYRRGNNQSSSDLHQRIGFFELVTTKAQDHSLIEKVEEIILI